MKRFRWVPMSLLPTLSALVATAAILQKQDDEPPLRLVVQLGNQAVHVEVGKPFTLSVDGKTVTGKVTTKPTRVFQAMGISFEYPTYFSFDHEKARDASEVMWTLESTDTMIIVQKHNKVNEEDLVKRVVLRAIGDVGDKAVQPTPTSLDLSGGKLKGMTVRFPVSGISLQQETFAFSNSKSTFLVIFQDSSNRPDTVNPHLKLARDLFAKTFKLEP